MVYGSSNFDGYKKISTEITGNSRWSINHELIFEYNGKFYRVDYSEGATEYQAESPFEYEPEYVLCTEIRQVEKLVKVWEVVD